MDMSQFCKKGTAANIGLILAVLFSFGAILLFALVNVFDIPSSVVDGYFPYADAMYSGVIPYTDLVHVYGYDNVWEYPPLAYVFLFIPRLFGATPVTYSAAYIVMMVLFFIAGMWCADRLARRFDFSRVKAILAYSLVTVLMFEFVLDRFDMIPVVLMMFAILFFSEKRYVWASVFLSLGMMVKLYPAILFPIFIMLMLRRGEKKNVLISMIAFVALAAACVLPIMVAGGDIMMMFSYHTDRPLEVESLAASVVEFISLLGLTDVTYVFSYGSVNVTGPLADAICGYMMYIMIAAIVIFYALYAIHLYKVRSSDEKTQMSEMNTVSAIAIMCFIVLGTVFSGQYMMWLIPMVVLFMMLPAETHMKKKVWWTFIIAEVLTQVDFAVNFALTTTGDPLSAVGITVVLVRNILVLAMIFVLAKGTFGNLFKKTQSVSCE